MKKALVSIFALSLMMAFVATASADTANVKGVILFGSSGSVPCSYGLSNNVVMSYDEGNSGQDYSLGDKHQSGNREFFTTNQSTNIYYFESNTYKGLSTLTNSLPTPGATSMSGTAL
jgi:hypothetical protein